MLQIFFCFWSAALKAGRGTEFLMGLCVWLINAALTESVGSREELYTGWTGTPLFFLPCAASCPVQRLFRCVRVCAQMHFTQQGSFPGRGLGTTAAAQEQLSNLSSCLPEVFSLLFPNKLKLKTKRSYFSILQLNLTMPVIRNNSVSIFLSLSPYFIPEICLSLPVKVSSP